MLLGFILPNALTAQVNVTTLGVQLKPILPSKYFGTGTEDLEMEDLSVNFEPNLGLNFGMVVRRGITRNWSVESGICMVQRNYTLHFMHPTLPEEKQLRFRYIGYEIPIQALVFVKLSDNLFMNASGGASIDLYPSNVESSTYEYRDTLRYDFYQKTYKQSWIQAALLANYGFEWRTPDKGFFYLGASYHRPFRQIGTTKVLFELNDNPSNAYSRLGGNYLTIELRYFFHEKPERKARKSEL
ncbi:MAG: outer membrane beta-barrel protein [Flavobacteriales bacterium]